MWWNWYSQLYGDGVGSVGLPMILRDNQDRDGDGDYDFEDGFYTFMHGGIGYGYGATAGHADTRYPMFPNGLYDPTLPEGVVGDSLSIDPRVQEEITRTYFGFYSPSPSNVVPNFVESHYGMSMDAWFRQVYEALIDPNRNVKDVPGIIQQSQWMITYQDYMNQLYPPPPHEGEGGSPTPTPMA